MHVKDIYLECVNILNKLEFYIVDAFEKERDIKYLRA